MQDLEQLTGFEGAPYEVWASIRFLVMIKAVVAALVSWHYCVLDLDVCLDLSLDLPTDFLPKGISVRQLTALHPHVALHSLEECLTSQVTDLVPL